MALLDKFINFANFKLRLVDKYLAPVVQLLVRLQMAHVFWASGTLKFNDWLYGDFETTLMLFEEEHRVPYLPVPVAAYLGTGGELVFSILLFLGLAGRFSAAGLLVMVGVMQVALPNPIHTYYALLLVTIVAWGPGPFSVDTFIKRKYGA